MVEMALDNFAVYLTWNVSDAMLYPDFHGDNSLPLAPPSPTQAQAHQIAFQIEYASLVRESVLNPALVGLIPPEPVVWSKTERLNKMVSQVALPPTSVRSLQICLSILYAFLTHQSTSKALSFTETLQNDLGGFDVFAVNASI